MATTASTARDAGLDRGRSTIARRSTETEHAFRTTGGTNAELDTDHR